MEDKTKTMVGGCSCGHVRYQLLSDPMIVHCCHCRFCQRQTGSAFVLNALLEANRVEIIRGQVNDIMVPTPSGKGQKIARCPKCEIAVWSNYYMGGLFEKIRFIRVGTLDNPDLLPPDIHIYTESKQPWITLTENDQAVEKFYIYETTWSAQSLARRKALFDLL